MMKKIGGWFLDHLRLVLTILTFTTTLVVIGVVMLNSYNSYKEYEEIFNQNDLDVRSSFPAQPTIIEINDTYKSAYGKEVSFAAEEMKVKTSQEEYLVDSEYIDLTKSGGSISVEINLDEKAFVDIVFTISSEHSATKDDEEIYGVEDLLNNVTFTVNGETMEEEINLENSGSGVEWHNLVMSGFALPAGPINVTISSNSGKNALMPQVQRISLFSNSTFFFPEE